jgi:hypothetical protein
VKPLYHAACDMCSNKKAIKGQDDNLPVPAVMEARCCYCGMHNELVILSKATTKDMGCGDDHDKLD